MNKLIFLGLITVVVFSVASCRKIQEDNLVKGLWEVTSIDIDTFTINNRSAQYVRTFIDTAKANGNNYMHSLLPNYTKKKATAYYRMDFQRDDIVFAYYDNKDTNVYASLGLWTLDKENELYLKVDKFLNGLFLIDKLGTKDYEFECKQNYIQTLDDTVALTLKIKRVK